MGLEWRGPHVTNPACLLHYVWIPKHNVSRVETVVTKHPKSKNLKCPHTMVLHKRNQVSRKMIEKTILREQFEQDIQLNILNVKQYKELDNIFGRI